MSPSRRRLVDALKRWWKNRELPRSRLPRYPASAAEASRIFQRWDRLNGRYYYRADVELGDGRTFRDVTFDSDTNIAVGAASQIGANIVACTVRRHLSPQPNIACPLCGEWFSPEQFVLCCENYIVTNDVVIFRCSRTRQVTEVQIRTGQVRLRYVSAPQGSGFTHAFTFNVPGLLCTAERGQLTIEFSSQRWSIPATESVPAIR